MLLKSDFWIIIHHWDSIKEGNNLLQKSRPQRIDKNLNLDSSPHHNSVDSSQSNKRCIKNQFRTFYEHFGFGIIMRTAD